MLAPIGLELPAHGEDGQVADHLVILHLVADTCLCIAPAGTASYRVWEPVGDGAGRPPPLLAGPLHFWWCF